MKLRSLVFRVVIGLLASRTAWAVTGPDAAAASLAGEWVLTTTIFGSVAGERLKLSVDQGKITGSIYQRRDVPLTGTVEGDRVRFEVKDPDGSTSAYDGRMKDGLLSGTVTFSDEPWGATPPATWRARRAATGQAGGAADARLRAEGVPPRVLEHDRAGPAASGRATRCARGRSTRAASTKRQDSRVLGGNPQTGPFYVEGAMPGDVLVVHVRKLRLNRPTAISDDGFVDRALTTDYASEHKDNNFNDVVWNLDLETGPGAARQADGPPEGPGRAGAADARLRRRGARLRFGGREDRRLGAVRRQHGFQRDPRGSGRVPSGLAAGRAALRRRRARPPGRRRAERQRARNVARRRVLRGPRAREIPRRARAWRTRTS